MWALRTLSGPAAGNILPLSPGGNLLGRAAHCQIRINAQGVSKEHCEILTQSDRILIRDLGSSNGTYVNGVRIQTSFIRPGDKIGLHDQYFELIANIPSQHPTMSQSAYFGNTATPLQTQAYTQNSASQLNQHSNQMVQQGFVTGLIANVQDYMERVALPGVYKLAQVLEFKLVLASFLGVFIFIVTALSMFPMMQITKASILNESKRRALSLARNLAQANQQNLLQGSFGSLSTLGIETEDGVKQVLIVQQSDGMILAPANKQGQTSNSPFVHTARKEAKSQVAEIDSNTIGASFPVGGFDPNTGDTVVKAHAIVLYDVGSLAFDDGRALSLFMQTLVIAALAGVLLFYFLYKLIEYPITVVNTQLDDALRRKSDSVQIQFQFPALQNLITNLNTLITRYLHGDDTNNSNQPLASNRDAEYLKLLNLSHHPTLIIRSDRSILGANAEFESVTYMPPGAFENQNITAISDSALQQNIEFVFGKSLELPQSPHSDRLEIGGNTYEVFAQALVSEKNHVEFVIVQLRKMQDGGNS